VIWHPYTQQKYAPDPIPVVRGEGVYLVDASGNYYIDAISSWWVNLHGHAHPYIAEKIYEQAKTLAQVIFAGFTHTPAVELAERILEILPGDFSKVFYSDNGSTAVEVAIKMAIQYWWNLQGVGSQESGVGTRESGVEIVNLKPRTKILALKNSYHGDTFGAMSVSERGLFTLAFQDKLFEVIFIDPANLEKVISQLITYPSFTTHTSHLTTHDSRLTTHEFRLDQIACFIYEPLLQGAGGMKIYEAEPLNRLLRIFKEHGIICIADEVMTGFGRTGKIFASEYVTFKPDIICLSKGLTGGTMALGVTACSKKIHDAFVSDDKLKTFFHGHSYTANPLACTAALASLDLLQMQTCMDSIKQINAAHCAFLSQLQSSNHKLQTKNHRCIGTILAFEIETGKDDYLNEIRAAITQKSLSKGVFLRPLGNTVYIMPPYCITEKELHKIYAVIIDILNAA
ncbi:MAG TPA: adenosylmethionine--8-amino-7-oxononanoate transaminase, partial [Flavitalea sp.]|nr:adenosylmethionine--8-amino-7-oxononanoate transaminase [Flavitalea sp.]